MRSLINRVICLVVVLALAGTVPASDSQQTSGTFVASCLVKITLDPAIMPLTPFTVESLITSSGVAGKAAQEVLELPDPGMLADVIDGIEVEWLTDDIAGSAPPAPRIPSDARGAPMAMYDRASAEPGLASSDARPSESAAESNPGEFSQDGFSGGGMGLGGYGGRMMGGMGMSAGRGGGLYGMMTPRTQALDAHRSATVRLRVELPDFVNPAAEKFLNALMRNLRNTLQASFGGYRNELADLLSGAEARQAAATEELAELLKGGTDLSALQMDVRDLAAQRRDLMQNMQSIEMDLAAMGARREAIEEEIARTRTELEHQQQKDEITRELQRIVQTNELLVSNLEKQLEAGRVSEAEFIKARESMMKARIELARRREELAKAAGGGQLSAYGSELSRMAIDAAENNARLRMLDQRLGETEAQLKEASKFDPRAAQIRMAREALELAEQRVVELRRRLAGLELPIVTVIGANGS